MWFVLIVFCFAELFCLLYHWCCWLLLIGIRIYFLWLYGDIKERYERHVPLDCAPFSTTQQPNGKFRNNGSRLLVYCGWFFNHRQWCCDLYCSRRDQLLLFVISAVCITGIHWNYHSHDANKSKNLWLIRCVFCYWILK